MPALSFKKQFVPFVEDGSKQHSIRAMRTRPFRVGDTLQLYYAQRTKQCRLLGNVPCVKVESFRLDRARVWIAGEELSLDEKDSLAWRDGFRYATTLRSHKGCFELMLEFWVNTHGDTIFEGQIIHWDWSKL